MALRLHPDSRLTIFCISSPVSLFLLPFLLFPIWAHSAAGSHQRQARSLLNRRIARIGPKPVPGSPYAAALPLAIDFFEGQRSGRINGSGQVAWRGSSGLEDGADVGVDLVGGYYVGADNLKEGFPMAYSMTMLAWSLLEYGSHISAAAGASQLSRALDALRWGTDYFVKAHPSPNLLWAQVGDVASDLGCWERPEDMDTLRTAFSVGPISPGSDVAAETAAALAAAALVFNTTDGAYAKTVLRHAMELFQFADSKRDIYSASIHTQYNSYSGYEDELVWAAVWLFRATRDSLYLRYLLDNDADLQGSIQVATELSWDLKFAGAQLLLTTLKMKGVTPTDASFRGLLGAYQKNAELYLCANLPDNPLQQVYISPDGHLFVRDRLNSQFMTSAAFALVIYADTLARHGAALSCSDGTDSASFAPKALISFAQKQMDYILGGNPLGLSLMVGYGTKYPQFLHHRGASIASFAADPTKVACQEGVKKWYQSPRPNPNVHNGAIVGGPDVSGAFSDSRSLLQSNSPALFINAPAIGALARLTTVTPSPPASPSPPPSPPPRRSPSPPPTPPPPPFDSVVTLECLPLDNWTSQGVPYTRWSCNITNTDTSYGVRDVTIACNNFQPSDAWNIFADTCSFPDFFRNLAKGEKGNFGFVQDTRVVPSIVVVSYTSLRPPGPPSPSPPPSPLSRKSPPPVFPSPSPPSRSPPPPRPKPSPPLAPTRPSPSPLVPSPPPRSTPPPPHASPPSPPPAIKPPPLPSPSPSSPKPSPPKNKSPPPSQPPPPSQLPSSSLKPPPFSPAARSPPMKPTPSTPPPSNGAGTSCQAQLIQAADGTGYYYLTLLNTGTEPIGDLLLVDPNLNPVFIWGLTFSGARGGYTLGSLEGDPVLPLAAGTSYSAMGYYSPGIYVALKVQQLACSAT